MEEEAVVNKKKFFCDQSRVVLYRTVFSDGETASTHLMSFLTYVQAIEYIGYVIERSFIVMFLAIPRFSQSFIHILFISIILYIHRSMAIEGSHY